MKPQLIVSQFSYPHMVNVYDVLGRMLFQYDPKRNVAIHKERRATRTEVPLNNIKIKKMVYSLDGKVLFEYDPESEIIVHKNGKIITEVEINRVKGYYFSLKALCG